jgi:hypothetical protein
MITDHINSPTIRSHYEDRRKQAAAFLMTMGAKALVLADQKPAELEHYDGINKEALLRIEMINKDRIRSLCRKINEKEVIPVLKQARNGAIRQIEILVQHDRKSDTCVVWKSKYNYLKQFTVTATTRVETVPNINGFLKFYGYQSSDNAMIFSVRLVNAIRHLDLCFQTPLEMEAFLFILHQKANMTFVNNHVLLWADII